MNGIYYKLIVFITLKLPLEEDDVVLRTSRTVPFQPVEGMTLVITNDDGDEYEITLGAPRYEFAETAFVEYQDEESLWEYMREGTYSREVREDVINYYRSFGFEEIRERVVVEQRATA